jgi:hypothetical protein
MKICIVSYANGGWYPQGLERMKKSVLANGYGGDFLTYTNELPSGCPPHHITPYAFKAFAFMEAARQRYDIVIWCDAAIQLIKPFSRVLEHIEQYGYMFLRNGWTSGEWCSDAALAPLGITREESFTFPHIMACVMGLDLRQDICRQFLTLYYSHALTGTFKGAWTNENQQVSNHPRVLGHRHDQTVASIVAWKLGMREFTEHLLKYASDPNPDLPDSILFENRGGYD